VSTGIRRLQPSFSDGNRHNSMASLIGSRFTPSSPSKPHVMNLRPQEVAWHRPIWHPTAPMVGSSCGYAAARTLPMDA
jgi:hypothetical protein